MSGSEGCGDYPLVSTCVRNASDNRRWSATATDVARVTPGLTTRCCGSSGHSSRHSGGQLSAHVPDRARLSRARGRAHRSSEQRANLESCRVCPLSRFLATAVAPVGHTVVLQCWYVYCTGYSGKFQEASTGKHIFLHWQYEFCKTALPSQWGAQSATILVPAPIEISLSESGASPDLQVETPTAFTSAPRRTSCAPAMSPGLLAL